MPLFGAADRRTAADRRDGRHNRVLHRHRIRARAARCRCIADRPRDEHHRRPRRVDEVDCAAGARGVRCHLGIVHARRLVRHCDRRNRHALDDRHDRRARRVRSDHRQRRRHRRDVGPAEGDPQHHRPARCSGQHDEGSDERLCNRFGRSRRARAVRRLHTQPASGRQTRRLQSVGSRRDHRPLHRRHGAVSVRRDGDGSGRPRSRYGRQRSAPSVQRDQRHHGRYRASPTIRAPSTC